MEIKSSSNGLFSLQVDETKDLQKVEQITIVVRYVQDADPTEELLDVVPASYGATADGLTEVVLETLRKNDIDVSLCICQYMMVLQL